MKLTCASVDGVPSKYNHLFVSFAADPVHIPHHFQLLRGLENTASDEKQAIWMTKLGELLLLIDKMSTKIPWVQMNTKWYFNNTHVKRLAPSQHNWTQSQHDFELSIHAHIVAATIVWIEIKLSAI